MKWLRSFNDIISKIEMWFLVTLVLFMIFLSFLQVLLRNFFEGGFNWADLALRNIVLWVGFMGASLATRENRHITVDALTKFFPHTWKVASDILVSLFSIFVGGIFIWASMQFVLTEFESKSIAFLGIPFWVVELVIPIGFLMITLRFILKIIEDVVSLLRGS